MVDATCPNCAAERAGTFCQRCGQNDRSYLRAVPPMVGELIRETFELDGRLVRTLRLLVFRPGALSREFSANRRAAYVTPVRLLLFASLLFFFTLSLNLEVESELPEVSVEQAPDTVAPAASDVELFASHLAAGRRADLDRVLAREGAITRTLTLDWIATRAAAIRAGEVPGAIEQRINGAVVRVFAEPEQAFGLLIDNLPFAMVLLLPALALLLKLMYVRQHRYYVEHLVFTMHVHTFIYLALALQLPIPEHWAAAGVVDALLSTWIGVYCVLALKAYYAQGWGKTAVKAMLLSIGYPVLVTFGALAVIALTLAML
jgi:hypothetical protein